VKEETGLDITDVRVAAVENVLFASGHHYVCVGRAWGRSGPAGQAHPAQLPPRDAAGPLPTPAPSPPAAPPPLPPPRRVVFMRGVAPPGAQPRVLEPTKCAAWRWCGWDELAALPEARFQPLQQLLDRGFRLAPTAVEGGPSGGL
jgi:hypothetical protein